ncbi:MAG: ABC transporter permease [Candidatus Cloacimonetes bacterium]|nr:ABC transporter permease [Candidatus Cloacimonadota bacterium]MDY0336884.1 ABC transporter permease [Candidatus Cloacimonadaceae bacterium]MDD2544447.1 ABC transporter permease [Candidatus Cloacimonadota bacterium]MDD3097893.1 ABC transporter permease [Candidatus Cloacimonadota bacterium]MDD3578637.1 ABC transporter permease [Candidatus Cloacimonadota bacterium]
MNRNVHQVKAERRRNLSSWLLSLPTMLWLTAFFLVPYLIVVIYSFLSPDIYDVRFEVSLDAYRQIFAGNYLRPFLLSFKLAIYTTLICILLGFPVAYYIARAKEKLRNTLLIFIIIPFWTNLIIRIFSWRIFLAYNGVLNDLLISAGLISTPLEIMRTDLAVILVMVYVYLPYMILPLYSTLEKLDFTLLNAAMDLGANEVKAFFSITLPLAVEGIFAGTLLVFIPSLGAYLIPQLVGNQRSLYVGQVITYKIKNIPRNWPMASALSLTLLLLVAVMLLIMYYLFRKHKARRLQS